MAHFQQSNAAPANDPTSPSVWAVIGLGRLAAAAVFVAAFLVLLIAVLAHLLPAGRVASTADIVTPLTLHVIFAAVVALAALLSRRWAWPVLLVGLPVILIGHAIGAALQSTDMPFSRTTPVAARDHLRVVSINTFHEHPDIDAVEHGLELSNADVLVLIEAGPDKQPMIDRLARIYPYRQSCAALWECSVAILSRFPMRAGGAQRNRLEMPPLAWAEIDASAIGLGTVTVIGTHVHRPSRSPRLHRTHMRALAERAAVTQGPLILAGDFNTGTMSASWRELVRLSGMHSAAAWAPTWPVRPIAVPQVAIDHILVSPGLTFGRTGTGPNVGSDHLGVWAEVRVPRAAAATPHTHAAAR